MRNQNGMHYANGDFRKMEEFYKVKWGCFMVLDGQRNAVPQLREKYPDSMIVMRPYTDNWFGEKPQLWADHIVEMATELRQYRVVDWTIANEQNLFSEGHPLGAGDKNPTIPGRKLYEDIRAWNLDVISRIREKAPWIRIHFPALSQGHNDDQDDGGGYVGFEILRDAVLKCSVLDVHTYWNPGLNLNDPYYGKRYRKVANLFPLHPIFISEYGAFPHNMTIAPLEYKQFLDGLENWVEGATLFLWDSGPHDSMRPWAVVDAPRVITMLQEYTKTVQMTLEETVREKAESVSWMPVNNTGALWKFAKSHNLEDQQTDEMMCMYNGVEYVLQVFNKGIVFCKKGEWDRVWMIAK